MQPARHTVERLRVLVADDDEDIRDVALAGLSVQGFEVVTASNGDEAFATAMAAPPDVLVLDIDMPGITGPEIVRALRRNRLDIPTVLVSGSQSVDVLATSLGVPFLTKPCSMQALGALIRIQYSRRLAQTNTGA
jgi:DNA-binding response OmpR family regulator